MAAYVQGTTGTVTATGGTTRIETLIGVAAGAALIFVTGSGGTSVSNIQSDKGDVFEFVGRFTDTGGRHQEVWVCYGAYGGTTAVTITYQVSLSGDFTWLCESTATSHQSPIFDGKGNVTDHSNVASLTSSGAAMFLKASRLNNLGTTVGVTAGDSYTARVVGGHASVVLTKNAGAETNDGTWLSTSICRSNDFLTVFEGTGPVSWSAPRHLGTVSHQLGTGVSVAVAKLVTAGSLLVVRAGVYSGGGHLGGTPISDTQGLTWTPRVQIGATPLEAIWTATANATGSITVTITPSSAVSACVILSEIAVTGTPSFLVTSGTGSVVGTTITAGGLSPASDALVLGLMRAGFNTGLITPANGWAQDSENENASFVQFSGLQKRVGAGTHAPSWTWGNAGTPTAVAIAITGPSNTAPVADAGSDQIVSACPGTATLNASGSSDADMDTLAYAWSIVSQPGGAAASITSPGSVGTGVTGLTVYGAYVFEVEVDDGNGGTDTDQVTVTVTNTPPTINAGSNQIIIAPVDFVNLAATESDPDACPAPLTGLWTVQSGPGGSSFGSAASASTTLTGLVVGVYVVRRTVDDGEDTAFDELTVTVLAAPPEIEPPSVDVAVGLTWVEFLDKAGTMHVSSKIELPDPSFYYHGFKEPRVITWGQIVRALSDRLGQYEGGEFTWVWSDTDRAVRALLAAPATKAFVNRPVTVRMIDDVNRRAFVTPRTMWKGLVRSYQPLSPLHFQVKVSDSLASKFSSENAKLQIPARLITNADFPDCPTQNRNLAVPIIYGDVSDPISATAPPLVTGTAARGAFIDGIQNAGFGNRTSTAAIPTGVTAVAAAGGTLSADVPNAEYGVWVTAVDAAGDETDPEPFYVDQPNGGSRGAFPAHVPKDTVDGTQKLQVAWSAAAGAVSYRVYLGWYYYGTRFTQMIQTASLSCEFTANPSQADTVTTANITPGASVITWGQFWYYHISAVMADGETGLSQVVFGINRGYRRPIRVEWLAVPGATDYRIYRKGAGGTFTHRWQVAAPTVIFDDDLLDTGVTYVDGAPAATGVVPVIPVGTRQDVDGFPWYAFLVAGHAVTEITTVFQAGVVVDSGSFGVTFAVPGKTNYSTYFPNTGTTQYLDINGNRYTMLFVRGPDGDAAADGTRPITVNVKGIETVGDSTGTLITDLHLQYLHVVQNWILQTYTSGAWLATPMFEDDATLAVVDDASFTAASVLAAVRIVGGYVGAFVIGAGGERISRRDLIARLNISGDVDSGFDRKSRFFINMSDDDPGVLTAAAVIEDVNDVLAGSFSVDERTTELFNRIPYFYSRDYTGKRPSGWIYESDEEDATSISDLDETKSSPNIELHMVRNTAVALDVIQRRLARSSETPRVATWQMGMAGLNHELGDVILMTHYQGIGTGGWTNHPLRLVRHTVDPDKFTVTIEALDVSRLF